MSAYVGWRPVRDDGEREWVQMRSGAGEAGWWHRHADETDYGGNPVDGKACRTCGAQMPVSKSTGENQ